MDMPPFPPATLASFKRCCRASSSFLPPPRARPDPRRAAVCASPWALRSDQQSRESLRRVLSASAPIQCRLQIRAHAVYIAGAKRDDDVSRCPSLREHLGRLIEVLDDLDAT